MGYTVPLKFISISQEAIQDNADFIVCASRILAIFGSNSHMARTIIKEEHAKGTLLRATGPYKTLSVVVLDNGTAFTSSLSTEELQQRLDEAFADPMNNKYGPPVAHGDGNLKEYVDMIDEEGKLNEELYSPSTEEELYGTN